MRPSKFRTDHLFSCDLRMAAAMGEKEGAERAERHEIHRLGG
jgi:hypothetical protein